MKLIGIFNLGCYLAAKQHAKRVMTGFDPHWPAN
jgi:hypothetical protein